MNRIDEHHKHIFELQVNAVKTEMDENATEEQINTRCEELKNIILDGESMNNRFTNPALQRIWNSKPRFKKL